MSWSAWAKVLDDSILPEPRQDVRIDGGSPGVVAQRVGRERRHRAACVVLEGLVGLTGLLVVRS